MTRTSFSRADKATQLVAFLANDPIARKRFPTLYHDDIFKRAKSLMSLFGNDLDIDLVEDVVQCFWLSLLEAEASAFHISEGSVNGFIKCCLKTAIRDVRATYTPPGQPTRLPPKDSKKAENYRASKISLDAPLPEAKNGETLADVFKDPQNRIDETTSLLSVPQILDYIQATSPSKIFKALTLIAADDISQSKAAKAAGMHHTSFRRGLDAWANVHEKYFC